MGLLLYEFNAFNREVEGETIVVSYVCLATIATGRSWIFWFRAFFCRVSARVLTHLGYLLQFDEPWPKLWRAWQVCSWYCITLHRMTDRWGSLIELRDLSPWYRSRYKAVFLISWMHEWIVTVEFDRRKYSGKTYCFPQRFCGCAVELLDFHGVGFGHQRIDRAFGVGVCLPCIGICTEESY